MIDYDGYELFEQDNVGKTITILGDGVSLTNSDIDTENFELNESLCSQNTLKIGVCESASIKFRIGYGTDSLVGKVLTVFMTLAGREDSLPIGVYTVTSDELSADKRYRNITAYDALNSILKRSMSTWYNTIFPDMQTSVTVKDFRDSFFNYLGVTQESATLINDSAVLRKTVDTDQLTGKDILQCICEMNACFGHITRTGTFKYIYLDELDTDTVIEVGDNKSYKDIQYEDFVTEPLTKLQIRQEENDIGVIVGSGTNDYVIEGNFLLFGMDIATLTPIANNILAKLSLMSYRPCTIQLRGNPCIEVGDGIKAVTSYTTVMTYVLQRQCKGVQALADTLKATGTKVYHNNTNSIHSQLVQLRGKSNVLERTIDETRSELVDMDAETRSLIVQTAEGLQVQINELYSELDGETQLYYTDETPTLLNYPAWDFTYNIPCNDTVQLANDLKFEYTDEYYRRNLRAIVYDETNSITYRFVKSNGVYYWDEVSNTETSLILSRLSTLEVTTEGIQTDVQSISYDLDHNYYTKSETESKISQSATDITASVSATYTTKSTTEQISAQVQLKVDRASLASEISASAGTITLNSNRLVINSSYFELTADGHVTASGANISGTITTGNITATGGTIGNFTLDTALHSGMTGLSDTTHSGVYMGSDGIALGAGAFKVTSAGALTASNANISGTITTGNITATGGSIGNFTLDTALKYGMTSLSDTSHNGIYLGSDGIALGGGAFKVTNAGALTATNANITGVVNATSGSFSGTVTTSNITATGGSVGGFTIDSTSIRSAALTSNADGSVGLSTANFTRTINGTSRSGLRFAIGSKFGVTNTGAMYADSATISNINATSGTIGSFSIGTHKFTYYDSLISSNVDVMSAYNHVVNFSATNQTTNLNGSNIYLDWGVDTTNPYCPIEIIGSSRIIRIAYQSNMTLNLRGKKATWKKCRDAYMDSDYVLVGDAD